MSYYILVDKEEVEWQRLISRQYKTNPIISVEFFPNYKSVMKRLESRIANLENDLTKVEADTKNVNYEFYVRLAKEKLKREKNIKVIEVEL